MPWEGEIFSCDSLIATLRRVELGEGDTVYIQLSRDLLGKLETPKSGEDAWGILLSAITEVVGVRGTIIVPCFSHSFERNEAFDRDNSPSVAGPCDSSVGFAEFFRKQPNVVRTADPNYSVAAAGPKAEALIRDLPNTSFGKDCVYERMLAMSGKICCIEARLAYTPFIHYVEEMLEVPYRYRKLFTGKIVESGRTRKQGWITSVPIQSPNCSSDGSKVERVARSKGITSMASVGSVEVTSVDCAAFCGLVKQEITRDAWATARGPRANPIELECARTHPRKFDIRLSDDASMDEMIAKLWRLPRDIISDGYDAALHALATQVPMTIHEYPSGSECWTWIVPEKWTCHEAWLETLDGQRLFSYSDNPLHVVSYSLPKDGVITREELLTHLHVHPKLPNAIPFIFKYYERDWGLCCSRALRDNLNDSHYRVLIKSESSYGTLKVGEVTVPGRTSETFVLCAHLCHPAMVNDDLSGVVTGIKVMQALLEKKDLRYTYRFLILPETIGSVAYLSHQQEAIPSMVGGLFLEMLGLQNPHALQLSFAGDTGVDKCLTEVLNEHDASGWTGPFRTVVGNDERQFNAPGVRVPMLSLSRVQPRGTSDWPYYPEYHSSEDSPDLASSERLGESRDLVLKMIEALEQIQIGGKRQVPINLYQGEVFCSRYGLNVDVYSDPEGNRALFDIIFLIDGTKSIDEIADICRIGPDAAKRVVERLRLAGLVDYVHA